MAKKDLCGGFTLIEIMVVIAIIGILAAIALPVISAGRKKAREDQCMSNLSQIWLALQNYDEHNEGEYNYPDRLTYLFDKQYVERSYLGDPRLFLCPNDHTNGRDGGKPDINPASGRSLTNQYPETDEGPDIAATYLPDEDRSRQSWLSYLFEFSGAPCDWWEDVLETKDKDDYSWREVKIAQLQHGDAYSRRFGVHRYPETAFPLLRCFWHQQDLQKTKEENVFNLALGDRNFFRSGPYWENFAFRILGIQQNPNP